MPETLRIGILQTDSVREEFVDRHGDYPQMFRDVLREAAAGDVELAFVDYDVRQGHYPAALDEVDGYLITGSRLSVYDDEPWIGELEAFVRRLHEARYPLVGICFGHQLVAQALGGRTEPASVGWGVGVHESEVVDELPWARSPASHFAMLSSHKDQVTALPDEARLLARSDFCPFAAFAVGDHMLCFQGHPEFSKAYAEDLMRYREKILGPEVFAAGIASLDRDVQRIAVSRWILDFLLGARAA